ncbi:MAG TPA: hypothetical protein VGN83_14595 [Falsiroseomonas sp.]|jgi:polyhydroxybutyrate depolymerase|nr:hypothetical protein [Falsiroseomonas sp.]
MLLLLGGAMAAHACGPDTDCVVGQRGYRIRLPDGASGTGGIGAILFAHGHGGTAAEIMADDELGRAAAALGVALIALQASPPGWALPGSPSVPTERRVDELAYVDGVVADAARRFAIMPQRIMVSGMSAGAMLVWNLACERGQYFAGFAPIAGTFWAPLPADCPSLPAILLHVHGTADHVVPLEGRAIRQSRQGSVFSAIALFARLGGHGPARQVRMDALNCALQRNAAGAELALCLHEGGHDYRVRDIVTAWRAIASRPDF